MLRSNKPFIAIERTLCSEEPWKTWHGPSPPHSTPARCQRSSCSFLGQSLPAPRRQQPSSRRWRDREPPCPPDAPPSSRVLAFGSRRRLLLLLLLSSSLPSFLLPSSFLPPSSLLLAPSSSSSFLLPSFLHPFLPFPPLFLPPSFLHHSAFLPCRRTSGAQRGIGGFGGSLLRQGASLHERRCRTASLSTY